MPRRARFRRRDVGVPRVRGRVVYYDDMRRHRYLFGSVMSQLMGRKYKRQMAVNPIGSYRFERAMSKYYKWNPPML